MVAGLGNPPGPIAVLADLLLTSDGFVGVATYLALWKWIFHPRFLGPARKQEASHGTTQRLSGRHVPVVRARDDHAPGPTRLGKQLGRQSDSAACATDVV